MKTYQHYFFERNGSKYTVSVTKVNGKSFRAISVCNPKDVYDKEKGIQLADLRCQFKVQQYKINRMQEEYNYAKEVAEDASKYARRLSEKLSDIVSDTVNIQGEINELVESL